MSTPIYNVIAGVLFLAITHPGSLTASGFAGARFIASALDASLVPLKRREENIKESWGVGDAAISNSSRRPLQFLAGLENSPLLEFGLYDLSLVQ